jgi:hypothetical protein
MSDSFPSMSVGGGGGGWSDGKMFLSYIAFFFVSLKCV